MGYDDDEEDFEEESYRENYSEEDEENEEDEDGHYYDNEIEGARKRLNPVFGLLPDEEWPSINGKSLELLYDYLVNKVEFPFYAEFALPSQVNGSETIIDISVESILDPDETEDLDQHGLVCVAKDGINEFKAPLSEVVILQDDPSFDLIEDYCIWYWDNKTIE